MGQVGILQPVVNRPVADELHSSNSADAIGAQDAILPHSVFIIVSRAVRPSITGREAFLLTLEGF